MRGRLRVESLAGCRGIRIYSVTAPERATLGVKLAANGEMTIDQLTLRYNGRPSAETQAMVEGWLADAFRRRGRNAAE